MFECVAKSIESCPTLCNPMDYSPQAPLSMDFSRQEYWSGLPCLPPGDLPHPGAEPASVTSVSLAGSALYQAPLRTALQSDQCLRVPASPRPHQHAAQSIPTQSVFFFFFFGFS